jgi:hypothetical protein
VPAQPVCLACRRPLAPEPDDLVVSLDGPAAADVAHQLAAEAPGDQATQAVVRELLAGLCRLCGRALP